MGEPTLALHQVTSHQPNQDVPNREDMNGITAYTNMVGLTKSQALKIQVTAQGLVDDEDDESDGNGDPMSDNSGGS